MKLQQVSSVKNSNQQSFSALNANTFSKKGAKVVLNAFAPGSEAEKLTKACNVEVLEQSMKGYSIRIECPSKPTSDTYRTVIPQKIFEKPEITGHAIAQTFIEMCKSLQIK